MKLDPRKWLLFWCLMSPSLAYAAYAQSINPDFNQSYAMGICVGETLSKSGHAKPNDPDYDTALKKAKFSCQLGAENTLESDATHYPAPTEKLSNAPKPEVSRVATMDYVPEYDDPNTPAPERAFERRSGMRR